MKKYLAIFGLILVTVIWGGGFVASDMALESLTPFQIMTFRFFLGTVILGGISLPGMKDIKKEEIRAGFFMGCALFAGFALQIVGLPVHDTVEKRVSDGHKCGDGTVYRLPGL